MGTQMTVNALMRPVGDGYGYGYGYGDGYGNGVLTMW